MPRHLINFVQINFPVLAFVFFDRAAHADNATLVTRIISDDDPISPGFAELLLELIATRDSFLQGRVFATMSFVADEF